MGRYTVRLRPSQRQELCPKDHSSEQQVFGMHESARLAVEPSVLNKSMVCPGSHCGSKNPETALARPSAHLHAQLGGNGSQKQCRMRQAMVG